MRVKMKDTPHLTSPARGEEILRHYPFNFESAPKSVQASVPVLSFYRYGGINSFAK